MAQEESARTISTHTAGGSPYLEAYAGGDAIKYREGMLNEAIKAAQEDRDKKTFALTNLKEARLQKQQDFELESKLKSEARQAKLDDLKFKEIEQKNDRENNLVEVSTKINGIDPMHNNAVGQLNDLRHDSNFNRLLAHPETREAISSVIKSKTEEIQNVVGGIQQEAKSKYGISANLSQFPTKEDGTWDLEKGYKEHLPSVAEQMRQKSEAAYETAPEKPGYTKYKEMDSYSQPVAKFVKTEDVNKQKLEDIKIARGGQIQAIAAMQALRQERDAILMGPTKDASKAATAIWKAKGKELARMPESQRQDILQKAESISSQIKDWTSVAMPKQEGSASTQQPPSAAAPTMTSPAQDQAATTPEPVSVAAEYSSENPYARDVQKEQTALQEKTAKEQQGKIYSAFIKALQEEEVAEKNLKDPSRLVQQYGEFPSEPTPSELASAYEKAKTRLESAKVKRLWYSARIPEQINTYLNTLEGEELEDFRNNYLAPAIFEEAGGNKEKATAIANQRGYSFK